MKIGKKLLTSILSIGLLLMVSNEASYADVDEKVMKEYYKKIENGDILPPQYKGDTTPMLPKDWIKSIKKQGRGGEGVESDVVLMERRKTILKIKKTDKEENSLKGGTFRSYYSREEAEADNGNNKNIDIIEEVTSNENGDVVFKQTPPYYGFYIKEVSAPKGYKVRDDAIIPIYKDNGVRFLGEMKVSDKGKNLLGDITFERNDGTTKSKSNKTIRRDTLNDNLNLSLRSLLGNRNQVFDKDDKDEDVNWLVFNDNGTEKLIPKEPIESIAFWNNLYNAGVVFGENDIADLKYADFTNSYYKRPKFYIRDAAKLNDFGLSQGKDKTYKPQYVNIHGKKYIVRLIRAYNENAGINDIKNWDDEKHRSYTKGSEWNRLILPLTADRDEAPDPDPSFQEFRSKYRYKDSPFAEKNIPKYAEYSNFESGMSSWTQETGYDTTAEIQRRSCRGSNAFAGAPGDFPSYSMSGGQDIGSECHWVPILEEIKPSKDLLAAPGWIDNK